MHIEIYQISVCQERASVNAFNNYVAILTILSRRCAKVKQILCCKTCIPEAKLFLIMFRIHGLVKIVCDFGIFFNIC